MISLKAKHYLLQLSKLEKKKLLKYDKVGYQIAVAGKTVKPCLDEKAWENLSTALGQKLVKDLAAGVTTDGRSLCLPVVVAGLTVLLVSSALSMPSQSSKTSF